MNKKLSHIVLIIELAVISLFHTAKFYRDTRKPGLKAPIAYKKPLFSVKYTALHSQ